MTSEEKLCSAIDSIAAARVALDSLQAGVEQRVSDLSLLVSVKERGIADVEGERIAALQAAVALLKGGLNRARKEVEAAEKAINLACEVSASNAIVDAGDLTLAADTAVNFEAAVEAALAYTVRYGAFERYTAQCAVAFGHAMPKLIVA